MEYWAIQNLIIISATALAVLIPITGLTLRFGLKPFLRELADYRGTRAGGQIENAGQTDTRLARIELQLESLESTVLRLAEVADFDRQLKKGRSED